MRTGTRSDNIHWGERTRAVHVGEGIDPVTRASSPNIVMSSTFSPDQVAGFSALNRSGYEGYTYARVSNPTVEQLATKIASLEHAPTALCFASGMAASHALLAGRLSHGDHLVISDTNYVGTAELVRDSLPRWGIEVSPIDSSDLMQVEAAIASNTKMVWIETPANPIMRLSDIKAIADLAHARGVRGEPISSVSGGWGFSVFSRYRRCERHMRRPRSGTNVTCALLSGVSKCVGATPRRDLIGPGRAA